MPEKINPLRYVAGLVIFIATSWLSYYHIADKPGYCTVGYHIAMHHRVRYMGSCVLAEMYSGNLWFVLPAIAWLIFTIIWIRIFGRGKGHQIFLGLLAGVILVFLAYLAGTHRIPVNLTAQWMNK